MDDSTELLFSHDNVVLTNKIQHTDLLFRKRFIVQVSQIGTCCKIGKTVVVVYVVVLDEFGSSIFTPLFESLTGLLSFHLTLFPGLSLGRSGIEDRVVYH